MTSHREMAEKVSSVPQTLHLSGETFGMGECLDHRGYFWFCAKGPYEVPEMNWQVP